MRNNCRILLTLPALLLCTVSGSAQWVTVSEKESNDAMTRIEKTPEGDLRVTETETIVRGIYKLVTKKTETVTYADGHTMKEIAEKDYFAGTLDMRTEKITKKGLNDKTSETAKRWDDAGRITESSGKTLDASENLESGKIEYRAFDGAFRPDREKMVRCLRSRTGEVGVVIDRKQGRDD